MADSDSTSLTRYDAARKALAECAAVDEAKELRDQAAALAAYAQQAKDHELEEMALEIRLRAERRAGELLREMEKNPGAKGNPGGQGARVVQSSGTTAQPRLQDLNISKDQSSRWQKLAEAPEDHFERVVADAKRQQEKLSTAGILRDLDARRQKRNTTGVAFSAATDAQTVEYAAGRLSSLLREVESLLALAAGCAAAMMEHPEQMQIRRAEDRAAVDQALVRARMEIVNSRHLSVETLRALTEALPEAATRGHWVADAILVTAIEDRLRSAARALAREAIL